MSQTPAINPRHVLDVKTLEMLVCPLTKTRLTLSADRAELISVAARLAFPIVNGVPLLSLEEARTVEPEAIRQLPELGDGDR
ncbi:Trm112 family protein [Devosia oryziradicis]|uniref:Trm112 family protein n=1 Tax=Devosia oryziradicis TaxID=2801335 RepID=A0ABX7C385_9HYPH|nr:Trm112 family protein [Devosia oryziradicis]QQR36476.1 Trm112 family protein [Devosia oryziradicis]